MRGTILGFVIFCALSSAAFAETPAPPAAAADAPTISQELGYFIGRWRVSARDPNDGATLELSYGVEETPGGSWLAGAGSSQDGAFAARDMWGRDPETRQLMRVIFDGAGAFAIVRAAGWEGDVLVFEGEAFSAGGSVRVRETITRISADRFDAVWGALRDGDWAVYSTETVTRKT